MTVKEMLGATKFVDSVAKGSYPVELCSRDRPKGMAGPGTGLPDSLPGLHPIDVENLSRWVPREPCP